MTPCKVAQNRTAVLRSSTDLKNLLVTDDREKWLIINTLWGTRYLKEIAFFKEFQKFMVYSNPDSSAFVYNFPKNDQAEIKHKSL